MIFNFGSYPEFRVKSDNIVDSRILGIVLLYHNRYFYEGNIIFANFIRFEIFPKNLKSTDFHKRWKLNGYYEERKSGI